MRARISFAVTVMVVGGLLSAAGGCDWRDLDKDAKATPVLSIGPPGGYSSKDDFGRIVLPLGAASDKDGVVARFMVSGATRSALALVELNAAGEATATSINSKIFGDPLHGNDGSPLTAIAEIPGPKPGRLLAASKSDSDGASVVFTVSLADPFEGEVFTFTTTTSDPYLGLGVAAANLTGGAAAEYLIASPDELKVYIDGKTDTVLKWNNKTVPGTCPVSLPGGTEINTQPLNRPILIGHFLPGDPDLQVAMSAFGPTGAGSVSFFGVDATAGITCLGTIAGTEPQFGRSFVVGDFNHDLQTDLLVGAPPTHAYVFLGPLSATSTGISLPSDSDAALFGDAVAAVNLEGGTSADVAAVGDPNAKIGEVRRAGTVTLFKLNGSTPSMLRKLQAHDVGESANYGGAMTGLPFCGMKACPGAKPFIPIIGAGTRVLAYFTLGGSDLRKP